MAFYSGVLLSPDGNPLPDGTLACMKYTCKSKKYLKEKTLIECLNIMLGLVYYFLI